MKTKQLILWITILFFSLNLFAFDYWEADHEELLVFAEDGDVEAIYVLGIYASEDGDVAAAEKWFLQASELDHSFSHYELGELYIKEMVPGATQEKAIDHFDRAGALGYRDAYHRLGHLYDDGKVIPQDTANAVKYYKLVDQDFALQRLVELYTDGKVPGQTDEDKFHWAMRGTEIIPDFYCYTVADYYFNGIGVEKNLSEALDWYLRAAQFGVIHNARHLAKLCHDGIEVEQDHEMAYFWILMAEDGAESQDSDLANIKKDLDAKLSEETRSEMASMLQGYKDWWERF